MENRFDVVVIGGGHAGIEAAHASARMGMRTAMVSMETAAIGRMSCNPAIGGVAKGQLVRDLDALGGLMGLAADIAGIQFRMLNLSKGPAVWGPRAQMDMELYADTMQAALRATPGLSLFDGELADFRRLPDRSFDLDFGSRGRMQCRALIITSGTFLGAVMHTGLDQTPGGRIGEAASNRLSASIRGLGVRTRRLKTGTPARLSADSIDYAAVEVQHGDPEPYPFSFRTEKPLRNHAVCWITHTNAETHDLLRAGFDKSPMFTGVIKGIGPRYCPSIEDKICRFADKDSHHLFLEPEGLDNGRIYVNGFSSSLPADVQDRALRTIPGLKECKVLRYGYAVEYDSVESTQLHPTYACKEIPGLYFAGQVNGTSGYEEAAAQGLMAGINAALAIQGKPAFLLGRSESYIGVLTDDLVSLELEEPYRMFTSRAEYRLHLRQDNAEERLLEKGHALGMVAEDVFGKYAAWKAKLARARAALETARAFGPAVDAYLASRGSAALDEAVPALSLLRRPDVGLPGLAQCLSLETDLTPREMLVLEASERYRGFWDRQLKEIERSKRLEGLRIPEDFDYPAAHALSTEARQKLAAKRPLTVGLAQRISGVTPADISGLIFHINRGAPASRR
ncbi:MAG TPA: tRNA uridine-5-carboxymethylaminomethyl(34) synthesis enzyme MnmG [Fibrobacteria bacterium]|nr:tRNA uridine-5-carboxymethylaminomethyl(34) synthesis enzyme MnmG [Fibrobacteria bacterium]